MAEIVTLKDITSYIREAMERAPSNKFDTWTTIPDKGGEVWVETTSSDGTFQKYIVDIRPVTDWTKSYLS